MNPEVTQLDTQGFAQNLNVTFLPDLTAVVRASINY